MAHQENDQSDPLAEFQKLRMETGDMSEQLRERSVQFDARGSSNEAVLKIMNDNFNSIRADIEDIKKKQNEQFDDLKTKVLGELQVINKSIEEIKKKQEENSEKIEVCTRSIGNVETSLRVPVLIEQLCKTWAKKFPRQHLNMYGKWLDSLQCFSEEGGNLSWTYWTKTSWILRAKVRIGTEDCKVTEDGKFEIRIPQGLFQLEVKGGQLTITHRYGSVVFV